MLHTYGTDPDQYAELYLPAGERRRGVVVIHGGILARAYDAAGGRRSPRRPCRARAWVAWKHRIPPGRNGGWLAGDVAKTSPTRSTCSPTPTPILRTSRPSAIGRRPSRAWAAAALLPAHAPGTSPRVQVTAVISQAGVLDLRTAASTRVGGTAVPDLIGGRPDDEPRRYEWADPIQQVPLPAPTCACTAAPTIQCRSARAKPTWPPPAPPGPTRNSWRWRVSHGARDPRSKAWAAAIDALAHLMPRDHE